MQKLQEKLKNVPRDTSLVSCSTNLLLNRVEKLSVGGKVLSCNNLEENQSQQHTGKKDLRVSSVVYVLNMRGKPLMPCSPTKCKRLLKKKKAVVIKRFPFTIQLTVATERMHF